MNPRLALYHWIDQYQLDRERSRALLHAAGLSHEPGAVSRHFWPVAGVLGGALAGFGVILWLAANWQDLGRMGRFALLQAAVLALCLGAAARPQARTALALAALLCIGGLFAYFGQTYQTGADPWQLFALWALLALPLGLGTRSDALWTPWALVAVVAISLWTHAHVGHRWHVRPQDLSVHLMAWTACTLLVVALSPAAARLTGAGPWALRTVGVLTVAMLTLTALGALFHSSIAPHYGLALGLFAVAAVLLAQRAFFEVFLLSAVVLGLNTLLVAGLAHWLLRGSGGDAIGRLLLLGFTAAGLLAASVAAITRVARGHDQEQHHG